MKFRGRSGIARVMLRLGLQVAAVSPPRILKLISKFANMSLGRGFGATTLKLEVRTVARFARSRGVEIRSVFDIGANVGLYSQELRNQFPAAKIYAFEPSGSAA